MTSSHPIREAHGLCIGHSHLRCLQTAAADLAVPLDAVNFWDANDGVRDGPDGPVLAGDLRQRVREHAGPVFSFIGGGAHSVLGLVAHPRRFDFVLPASPGLPLAANAEVLPVDLVRAILRRDMAPFLHLMSDLRSVARHRVVHLEPPAPCGEAKRMLPHIPWPLFPGMLRELAPRHLHYKLWRLHSEILLAHCAANDIDFLPHPGQTTGPDGFLRPEFFHDGVHANSAYGALLLDQMREVA